MNVTGFSFFAFLALAAILCRFSPSKLRAPILVLLSLIYLWFSTWQGAALVLGVSVFAFFAAKAIERTQSPVSKQLVTWAGISLLILLLAVAKLPPQFAASLKSSWWVPIGLSYYTFKLITYLADVYWSRYPARKNFFEVAAHAAFFPQILAGPIQRNDAFTPQLDTPAPATWGSTVWAVQRILLGLFKKFIVAENIGLLIDAIYGQLHQPGAPVSLIFYSYPLQLYADFSGLTDIAIGSASLLGIVSPENFNNPFASATPSEFWRRWHITLSTILTDYVFMPARMATRNLGNLGLVLSLFLTMTLIGLWHGLRATYLVFGLVHATYLSIDALTARTRKRFFKKRALLDSMGTWAGRILTYHLVAASFLFFRSETLADATYILTNLTWQIGLLSDQFTTIAGVNSHAILIGFAAFPVAWLADWLLQQQSAETYLGLPNIKRWAVSYCTAILAILAIVYILGVQTSRTIFVYAMF